MRTTRNSKVHDGWPKVTSSERGKNFQNSNIPFSLKEEKNQPRYHLNLQTKAILNYCMSDIT